MVHCVFRYNIVWPNLGSLSNKTYRRNDKTGPGKGPKIGGVLPQPFLLDSITLRDPLRSNSAVIRIEFHGQDFLFSYDQSGICYIIRLNILQSSQRSKINGAVR